MNLNLINLPPTEWSKDDWRDAYAQYCKKNLSGPKTKKEYYDMVLAKFRDLNTSALPPDLLTKWMAGRSAAKEWARQHGCDMNGRLLSDIAAEKKVGALEEMADDIADLTQRTVILSQAIKRRN